MKPKKPNIPHKSFEQIQSEYNITNKLEPREKLSALKSLGFNIKMSYEPETLPLDELKVYIDLLSNIIRIPNRPATLVLLLNKMYAEFLTRTGNANPQIIQKKSGLVQVESGQIMISDKTTLLELYNNYSPQDELKLMNLGKLFVFGTGGDGPVNVQCRVVDSSEPVLTLKEYKCSVGATEAAIISVPSGMLQITCLSGIDHPKDHITTEIEPGNYKVIVHSFVVQNKFQSYYVVLAKSEQEATNQLQSINVLE